MEFSGDSDGSWDMDAEYDSESGEYDTEQDSDGSWNMDSEQDSDDNGGLNVAIDHDPACEIEHDSRISLDFEHYIFNYTFYENSHTYDLDEDEDTVEQNSYEPDEDPNDEDPDDDDTDEEDLNEDPDDETDDDPDKDENLNEDKESRHEPPMTTSPTIGMNFPGSRQGRGGDWQTDPEDDDDEQKPSWIIRLRKLFSKRSQS